MDDVFRVPWVSHYTYYSRSKRKSILTLDVARSGGKAKVSKLEASNLLVVSWDTGSISMFINFNPRQHADGCNRDHDMYGPAGPTAFWKSHDGIEEKKPARRHSPMTRFTMPLY